MREARGAFKNTLILRGDFLYPSVELELFGILLVWKSRRKSLVLLIVIPEKSLAIRMGNIVLKFQSM